MARTTTSVTMNGDTVHKILRGEVLGVANELNRRAKAVARAAGAGYSWEGHRGVNRWRTTVYNTTRARARETLLRALDAGRTE
jgi:hypothetical protein